MSAQFIFGLAQAIVCGVFVTSAAGKLAGCRPSSRAMCIKGGFDAVMALLAALIVFAPAVQAAATLAVCLATGGWIRERITSNTVCNCFGVLTSTLHPWRNHARALLFVGGLIVLASQPYQQLIDIQFWAGTVCGLAILLAACALVFARESVVRQPSPTTIKVVETLAPGTIGAKTIAGRRMDGSNVALGDLMQPGLPLLTLLTSPTCSSCRQLKARLAPLVSAMPWPMVAVIESEAGADAARFGTQAVLFDPSHQWRATLGVKSIPALAVINSGATNLAFPVAMGETEVFALLVQLLVTSELQGGAPPLSFAQSA